MKIYNYIYTPILGTGYRNFTDAPPPMISVINEFIAGKLQTKPEVQYHILTTQDHLPEDFLRDNFVLVMTKFSNQADERGRQGLQYYHIVVINQPSKELAQFVESDPREIYLNTYAPSPENKIEEFLRLARVESLINTDELFKKFFITAQVFASILSSSETSGTTPVRAATASSSDVLTPREASRAHLAIEDTSRRLRLPKRRPISSPHGQYATNGYDSFLRIVSIISLMLILVIIGEVIFCMKLMRKHEIQLVPIASQTRESSEVLGKISALLLDKSRSPKAFEQLSGQVKSLEESFNKIEQKRSGDSENIKGELQMLKESHEKLKSELSRSTELIIRSQNRLPLAAPSVSGTATQPRSTGSFPSGTPASVSNSK